MQELGEFGRRLKVVGDEMTAVSSAVRVGAVATAMPGGSAAGAVRALWAAWTSKRTVAEKHITSHAKTLVDIAQAYQHQEDRAQTEIRGFFDGRTK